MVVGTTPGGRGTEPGVPELSSEAAIASIASIAAAAKSMVPAASRWLQRGFQ